MNLGEDTIQPVTVTNFRFLQTNFMWVRFLGCCFVEGFGGFFGSYQNHASLTEETVIVFTSWEWERGAPPFYLQVGIQEFVYLHFKHNFVTLSVSLNTATSYLPSFLSYIFLSVKWVA